MNLDDLREDDLRAILRRVELDIGSANLAEIIKAEPPNGVKRGADWLHANCCVRNHNIVPDSPFCAYYQEEEYEGGWSMTEHRYWTTAYFTLLEKLTTTPNYLSNMFSQINILKLNIADACQSMPPLRQLFQLLLMENPNLLLPPPRKVPPVATSSLSAAALTDSALSTEK
jgi:hypothetical protein